MVPTPDKSTGPVIRAGVLTVSDKGSQGLREDESGTIVADMIRKHGYRVAAMKVIPDDRELIAETLISWADIEELSLILTSGGTGLSPRDCTPQATEDIVDFQVPGIPEAMRASSLKKTPHAMISRAIAGVRKNCLIINLPGSPRGAKENLRPVLPALDHALSKLLGDPSDCAV